MTRRRALAPLVLSALFATAAGAQTVPLTAEDVLCNSRQLGQLAARTAVTRPAGAAAKSVGVAYTFSSRIGDFSGLAYTQQFTPAGEIADTPEHHLWFSTNAHEVRLLRNPARPALPTLSVTRNTLNSDLVPDGHADRFDLVIDPTLDGPATSRGFLHLDNLDGPLANATSTRPGRGLAGVVSSCHDRFTEADLHMFALLAKTLRAFPFTGAGESRDSVMTIYRDTASEPTGTGRRTGYRIDVLPLDGADLSERSSFTLEVEIGSNGELGDARLEILPTCGVDGGGRCTGRSASAMLVFSSPVLPGAYWQMSPATPSACTDDLLDLPGCDRGAVIRLSELLAGSTWLKVR